jgi:integrative and conjugative element protein (TIGR02256 family)
VHNLNYELIFSYFLDSDFDVEPITLFDNDALSVSFEVGSEIVTIVHICVREITKLPQFFLVDSHKFGRLAHVIPVPDKDNIGSICVNEQDSVSINFEKPELVFEESIKRHIALLTSLIHYPKFNDDELLREFNTNWELNNRALLGDNLRTLYCEPKKNVLELFQVYKPVHESPFMNLPSSWIAIAKNDDHLNVDLFFNKKERQINKEVIACVLPLQSVETNLPSNLEQLKDWLCDTFLRIDKKIQEFFTSKLLVQRAKEFWLIFNVETPSGISWFGIRLVNDSKKPFPNTVDKMHSWSFKPLFVEIFNKDLLMPRSGAKKTLDSKKILLVGAGSVGSELADKLGAMGIGHLDITDPDAFTTSNLYRHTLNRQYISCPKSLAVKWQLESKYPWIKVGNYIGRLLDYRQHDILNSYDLIIIAIGSPTHERIFHDYVAKNRLRIPTIYTWLEGYGVGGHAVLDIPNKKGCLRCAYVDPENGSRGLASNLNFLQSDQNIVKNYAGCGEMFIPYGAMSSAQTALIAGDLAMNYLDGKLIESTKVSWKGSDDDAKNEGLKFTKRYDFFSSSLQKQPLYHPLCDVCNDEEVLLFKKGKCRVVLPRSLENQLIEFKQNNLSDCESAGLLIGHVKSNGDIWVNKITKPKEQDIRTRAYFKLDADSHQDELNDIYTRSDQLLGYLGTWHTHPQNIPTPSGLDISDWKKHCNENVDRPLIFVVVGLKQVSIYMIESEEVVELYSVEGVSKWSGNDLNGCLF